MRFSVGALGLIILISACVTLSPRSRIENRLEELGLSERRSECLATELDERLDRRDLEVLADFVGELTEASSAGETLDALLSIDNPRVAAAMGRASLACAFGG